MPKRQRVRPAPGREGYVYVVGEDEEPTGPVKIGITTTFGSRAGRGGLSGGNWRTLSSEHERTVPWSELRWFEWQVHRALMPWHVRGEWFDVRHLANQLGGWGPLLDAAIAGTIDGAASGAVEQADHRLVTVARHWPTKPMRFSAHCSCGEELQGAPNSAFITVIRLFAAEHLGFSQAACKALVGLPDRAASAQDADV